MFFAYLFKPCTRSGSDSDERSEWNRSPKTMDDSYLCKDVLGLIFSLLPEMYIDLCTLCKEAKSLLGGFGVNIYDYLIAHGITSRVTADSIEWYKNGKLHDIGDKPAFESTLYGFGTVIKIYKWYKNGLNCRDEGPAIVKTYNDECIFYEEYISSLHGLHRDDGPAIIDSRMMHIEWYYQGKLHRDDGPAVINKHISISAIGDMSYYNHGQYKGMDILTYKIQEYDEFFESKKTYFDELYDWIKPTPDWVIPNNRVS